MSKGRAEGVGGRCKGKWERGGSVCAAPRSPPLPPPCAGTGTRAPHPPATPIHACAPPPHTPSQMGFSRAYEDYGLKEAASFRLPEPGTCEKLRLDVAWKFWHRGPEEEMEGVSMEFVIKFFDGSVSGGAGGAAAYTIPRLLIRQTRAHGPCRTLLRPTPCLAACCVARRARSC